MVVERSRAGPRAVEPCEASRADRRCPTTVIPPSHYHYRAVSAVYSAAGRHLTEFSPVTAIPALPAERNGQVMHRAALTRPENV